MDLVSIAIWGVVIFTVLGIFFGFALAATARKFDVPVNPVVDQVQHVLPAANCGVCGFAGCAAYAEAVVEDPAVASSKCVPGGQVTATEVARLTGKLPQVVEARVAVLRCHGTTAYVKEQAEYRGIRSCAAASLVFGGPRSCKNGCIGMGDCVRVCPFGAMSIASERSQQAHSAGEGGTHTALPGGGATRAPKIAAMEISKFGIVEIDHVKCTGCGLCTAACPKKILELYPRSHRVELSCVAREKVAAVRCKCMIGCTTCQKCVGACPAKAVTWDGTTIRLDHVACVAFGPSCLEVCVDVCPTFIIHRSGQLPLPEDQAHPAPAELAV